MLSQSWFWANVELIEHKNGGEYEELIFRKIDG